MERLGRYELIERLGRGSYGTVYRARLEGAHGFEKQVALKVIDVEVSDENLEQARALINEARLGGKLKHSGITDIYDFGEVEGRLFIAMEFIDGITLSSVLHLLRKAERFLPLDLLVDMFHSLAVALAYAHECTDEDGRALKVVHRDLKPENIMLSWAGEMKILDFGIAHSAAAMFRTTAKDMTKGTPGHMSPEQVTGEKILDARSDIFALGTILAQAMTLKPIFEGNRPVNIMYSVLKQNLVPLLFQLSEVDAGIAALIGQMLIRDRERRVQSARLVARELATQRRRYPATMTLPEFTSMIRIDDLTMLPRSFEEVAKLARSSSKRRPVIDANDAAQLTGTPTNVAPIIDVPTLPADPLPDEILLDQLEAANPFARADQDEADRQTLEGLEKLQALAGPAGSDLADLKGDTDLNIPLARRVPSLVSTITQPRVLLGILLILSLVSVQVWISLLPDKRPVQQVATPASAVQVAQDQVPPTSPIENATDGTPPLSVEPKVAAQTTQQSTTTRSNADVSAKPPPSQQVSESSATPDSVPAERMISVNSRPWSHVFIDGENVGSTPLTNYVVGPDVQDIELVSGLANNASKRFVLGHQARQDFGCWDMSRDAPCSKNP